ncbi:MAG: hypothetical protein JWO22_3104 [Frankiales bacterium]|nr:hypothetical protein [Frankiales bacterium]
MEDEVLVLRPSAVLPAWVAADVISSLEAHDVSCGGVWCASIGLWQRYDRPWDGHWGFKGRAQVVGSIGAVYGTPTRYDITIYRVTLTEHGRAEGWTHDALVNDALRYGRVTLAQLPRARSSEPPPPLRLQALELLPS